MIKERCVMCDGTGWWPYGYRWPCHYCDGTGEVPKKGKRRKRAK